jgi:hypothetical protein
LYLKDYLNRTPSPGYGLLVQLIREGYSDLVVTFNYDNLVEKALNAAGLRQPDDYRVIIRGDFKDDRVVSMTEDPDPPIKLLKLHGSLMSGNTFLFTPEEMSEYPEPIAGLVRRLTARNIIVCGYAFNDLCVIRAFSKPFTATPATFLR